MAQAQREEAPIHEGLSSAFDESVNEGEQRLARSWPSLLATGTVGGIDVGLGVFGLLVVYTRTHNELAAALTFSIGFIALALAHSELFTENFLVPFAAVAADRARPLQILRLWVGTLCTNLLGGWVITLVMISGFPELKPAAIHFGVHFLAHGTGVVTFTSAVMGGALITLMTWMERGTESVTGKLAAAVACGFLLAAGGVHHAIVLSLEMFAAIHAHAPFGYASWARTMGWATMGNMVGGIGLVTILRLFQVGPSHLQRVRDRGRRGSRKKARAR